MSSGATLSYADIGTYAELIARAHRDQDDPDAPIDLSAFVASLGGRIVYQDIAESLRVFGPKDFVIYLPPMTSSRRDRFTIAHELGHYFLHYRVPKLQGKKDFNRRGVSRKETEANVFAASLLMPQDEFRAACRELDNDEWLLADRFCVSPAAATVRMQVLGVR